MSRDQIINLAASQVGTKENPPDSNLTKYGKWFGINGQKWCATFVSWIYYHAGYPLGVINTELGYSNCESGYKHWAMTNELTDNPKPGDIVLFDWDHDEICDHTGIFLRWIEAGSIFQSFEGNTSTGNNSNGGEVMLRLRNKTSVKAFVSPIILDQNINT
jgi:hypothetical protein